MDKREMYRSIIVSRSSKPLNYIDSIPKGYKISNANVDTCQDDFDIYLKYKGKIQDIKFSGKGCSISTSALDMISQYLIGKTKDEAIKYINNYRNMIMGKEYTKDELQDLIALENVSAHLNRVGCALIGANTLSAMLGEQDE